MVNGGCHRTAPPRPHTRFRPSYFRGDTRLCHGWHALALTAANQANLAPHGHQKPPPPKYCALGQARAPSHFLLEQGTTHFHRLCRCCRRHPRQSTPRADQVYLVCPEVGHPAVGPDCGDCGFLCGCSTFLLVHRTSRRTRTGPPSPPVGPDVLCLMECPRGRVLVHGPPWPHPLNRHLCWKF